MSENETDNVSLRVDACHVASRGDCVAMGTATYVVMWEREMNGRLRHKTPGHERSQIARDS